MSEQNEYKINLKEIANTFTYTEKGLTHAQGKKFKLLPYVANEKTLVSEFSGVTGAFSRCVCNKKLKRNIDFNNLIEDITDRIDEFEGESSKEVFKDIIRTMFIYNNKLVDFDIKTINYIEASNSEEKIGGFLKSVLFDESLNFEIDKHYNRKINNILYNIVLDSLPELDDAKVECNEYVCQLPYVRDSFIKDFKFLINNEELYKDSLERFLSYYYMFYISQLAMKLSKFEKADLTIADPLYYTLSWESTSKNRTAYRLGWENLKGSLFSIFSHAVVLEMLNHNDDEKQLNYIELNNIFKNLDEEEVIWELDKLINSYKGQIKDVNWTMFNYNKQSDENKVFNKVRELFNIVEYQFANSTRKRAYEAYRNWFVKFYQQNFGKRRGQLGYNLNMTEEDIILITKLCINNNEKLKLNVLFREFEKRGIYFDRDSKTKIIQLYEKLNILEKKSDSGDAQYVRSIL